MRSLSFRSIIVITLIFVIGTISFSAFYIFNHFQEKLIYNDSERNAEFTRNIVWSLELMKDEFYNSAVEHDEGSIISLLQSINERSHVLNSYLYSEDGEFKFSLNGDTIKWLGISGEELNGSKEDFILKSFPLSEKPFSRAYFHMHNYPSCYGCHSPDQEHLGYMVVDVAMYETIKNTAFIRKSSLLFTLAMVIVIIGSILFIHYRFVRKSLGEFKSTIAAINSGNLDKRLSIPETKELGFLGKYFNDMLDTFQQTQKELKEFHENELHSKYKMATIGEMSARLAHEIRNPITGIANAIEIIVNETKDQQNIPILEEIQRQAKRVNNAISDLLKYSRKKDINLIMNNINEIIKPLSFFLQNHAKDKDIKFGLKLQDNVPLFRFDHMQIEDVLLNLGINAIQAIRAKGSVTFKTRFSSILNRVYISVSDNGKGIPDEELSRIFHPFFTTRNEGTGLGLAIVKEIIDKHKGEIWAENNKDGGCTFTISMPVDTE